MAWWLWFMSMAVASMVYRSSSQQNDTFIHIDGDVYIAALFPIHRSYNGGCGSINPQDGIERVVAAMFALDSVNDRLEKETGFRLGMLAKDTCYSNDRALEESLQFAQSRFKDESKFTYSDQCYSLLNGVAGNQTRNTVVGVIGPSTSEESMQVATLLKLFKLPQISYAATSPELSDKDVLPFFLRTVPSDYFQIQVIFSIMTRFKWSYFSMIHEDSNYGENGAAVIEENVRDANLCLGLKHRVSKRDSDKHLQILVTEILQRNNTNGETIVVLYVSYDLAIRILRLIGKFGNGDNVRLIGVDAWIGRDIPSDKMVKRAVEGALGVTLMSTTMPSFKDFFKTTVKTQTEDQHRWFQEYWEAQFNCTFSSTTKEKTRKCSTEKFSRKFREKMTLYTIRNSVFLFGQALLDIHRDTCQGADKLCQNMKTILGNGKKVLEYLKNVKDPFNTAFSFENGSDGPPLYSVFQYHMDKDANKYRWTKIGNFTEDEGLTLGNLDQLGVVKYSVCSDDCKSGEIRRRKEDQPCCWDCIACPTNSIVNITNPSLCLSCGQGYMPGRFKNSCEPIPIKYFSFSRPFAMILTSLSGVGIVLCLLVLCVFIVQRETPIVKASSFISSVLLLTSITLSFTTTTLIFVNPTSVTCSFIRVLMGLSYTIAYSAIFSKLYMLSSAFSLKGHNFSVKKRASKLVRKDKVLSSHAFLIALFLTFVHLLGLFVWIILEMPVVVSSYPVMDGQVTQIVICNDAVQYSYIMVLLWPFVLMIICVSYACKLRNLPEGFNEKNKITYCTAISILLWIVFVPVYAFSLNNNLRVIMLSLALFIHGTVFLSLLFLPKVYIVVFRKDKNTKETVLGTRSPSPTPLSNLSNSKRRGSNLSYCQYGHRSFSQNGHQLSQQAQQTEIMENSKGDHLQKDNKDVQSAEVSDSDDTVEGTLPFKRNPYKRFLSRESTSSSRVNGDVTMTALKHTLGVNVMDGITNFNSSYGFRPMAKENEYEGKPKLEPKDSNGFEIEEKFQQIKTDIEKIGNGLNSEHHYSNGSINMMNEHLYGVKYHESLRRKPLSRRHSNSSPDLLSKGRLAELQQIRPFKMTS